MSASLLSLEIISSSGGLSLSLVREWSVDLEKAWPAQSVAGTPMITHQSSVMKVYSLSRAITP